MYRWMKQLEYKFGEKQLSGLAAIDSAALIRRSIFDDAEALQLEATVDLVWMEVHRKPLVHSGAGCERPLRTSMQVEIDVWPTRGQTMRCLAIRGMRAGLSRFLLDSQHSLRMNLCRRGYGTPSLQPSSFGLIKPY